MKRLAALLATCMASSFTAAAQAAADPSAKAMEMEGVDLYLHSSAPSFGQREDPTFWVHAERGRLLDQPALWSLESARATIYRQAEDNLVLVAKSGTFDQERQAAQLSGGVRLTSGPLVVEIEQINWDETERVARSESVATLHHGSNRIVGDSIAIFPDDDRVELGGGMATIQLAEATDDETKAESSSADKFKRLDIEEQHGTSGSLKGAPLQRIEGPVRMSLIGKADEDTLRIKADLVTLEYGDEPGTRTPSRVTLKGNVELKQGASVIRSNEAELNLSGGAAKFSGSVVFSGEGIANASGPFLDMNLDTGEWSLGGPGGVISYDFSAPESAGDKKP